MKHFSRRSFLRGAGAVAGCIALPWPSRAQQVYTQNAGLTLSPPRVLSFKTNDFCYPICLGSGDEIWVGSSGWDGVTQNPPYTGTSKIERFNRKTGSLIASITNGPYYDNGQFHGVSGLTIGHGLLLGADRYGSDIIVINPSNNTIAKRTAVNAPRDVITVSDGFWVSEVIGPSVVKLDTNGDVVAGSRITLASDSIPFRLTYDGSQYVYLADAGLNRVTKIDNGTGGVIAHYNAGTGPWACTPDGNLLAVANVGSHDLTFVDMPTGESSTLSLTSGDAPHDVRVLPSAAGNVYAVACSGTGKIKLCSLSTILHTITVQNDPAVMQYDGEYLYNSNAISSVVTATRLEGVI